jgi:hypothetical protein
MPFIRFVKPYISMPYKGTVPFSLTRKSGQSPPSLFTVPCTPFTIMPLFETITDLIAGVDTLSRRKYGVIEMVDGRFDRVRVRPYPKIISAPEIVLFGERFHRRVPGDRFWLYYNQPWRFPNFLVLKYVISARQTSYGSLARALDVLEYIAWLKCSDAMLCDAGNWRIGEKQFGRWGWIPHCPSRWHRHYIKRFYGTYPPPAKWIQERETDSICIPRHGVTEIAEIALK